MAVEYSEQGLRPMSRGRNISVGTLPAKRVASHTTSSTYEDAIDSCANVSGTTRLAGVIPKAIEAGRVGDLATDGVQPVESTGAEILVGQRCAVEQSTGRVYSIVTTAPSTGVNVQTIGIARTGVTAASPAGTVVMLQIEFASFQG